MKHASCTIIELEILQIENQLKVTVFDNGKGFIYSNFKDALNWSKSFGGIKNMKERAKIIGAELQIISEIEIGTWTSIQLNSKN